MDRAIRHQPSAPGEPGLPHARHSDDPALAGSRCSGHLLFIASGSMRSPCSCWDGSSNSSATLSKASHRSSFRTGDSSSSACAGGGQRSTAKPSQIQRWTLFSASVATDPPHLPGKSSARLKPGKASSCNLAISDAAVSKFQPRASAAWACPSSTPGATTTNPSPRFTAPRSRHQLSRHLRRLRTAHQRRTGRPRDQRQARPSRGRHKIRHRARSRRIPALRGVNGKPDYVRQSCEGSLRRLGIETHRSLLSAPRRSQHADRRDRRRDGGTREGRQGPLPRTLGSRRRNASPRRRKSIPSPRCKPNIRCGRAIPKTKSSRSAANSASDSSPTARSAADFSPVSSSASKTLPPTTTAATRRAFREKISRRTSTCCGKSKNWQKKNAARRRNSRSRG